MFGVGWRSRRWVISEIGGSVLGGDCVSVDMMAHAIRNRTRSVSLRSMLPCLLAIDLYMGCRTDPGKSGAVGEMGSASAFGADREIRCGRVGN